MLHLNFFLFLVEIVHPLVGLYTPHGLTIVNPNCAMSLMRKLVLAKVERQRLNSRISTHRKNGNFRSKRVAYSKIKGASAIQALLPIVTRECWKDSEDVLKAPHCNKARSAYFSKAATNQYYGWDLPITAEEQNGDSTIRKRTAYGVGSGAASIGLDPRYTKIHKPSKNLALLTIAVSKAIAKSSTRWAKMLHDNPINNVALKWYMAYQRESGKEERKELGMHVDVTHNRRTYEPCRNNSQKPNTITALLTFGADKHLWFRQYCSSKDYNEQTLIHFLQTSGTLIVLDPQDERPKNSGKHWRHGSTMATKDGITITYTFRCVQCSALVYEDGTLVNPKINERRQKLFDEAENQFKSNYYKNELAKLEARMSVFLDKYCST